MYFSRRLDPIFGRCCKSLLGYHNTNLLVEDLTTPEHLSMCRILCGLFELLREEQMQAVGLLLYIFNSNNLNLTSSKLFFLSRGFFGNVFTLLRPYYVRLRWVCCCCCCKLSESALCIYKGPRTIRAWLNLSIGICKTQYSDLL